MEHPTWLAFLFSFIAAVVVTPLVIKWYRHHNWLDDPEQHLHAKKTHQTAVPRGGGLVVGSVIIILSLFFLGIDQHLIGISAGALLLMVIGFFDDVYDIHPLWRLAGGALAACLVVGSGIGIAYINNPLGTGVIDLSQPQLSYWFMGETRSIWIVADLFAVLFIVWNMNIVNWSKGVDGQMPGFVSIAMIFIGLLSQRFSGDPAQFDVMTLSFLVAGAFAGLLVWNFYPQKIMPGYGAGSLAGYFLGVLSILAGAKVATTLMVLAIPTADAIFTISRRLLAGKSPFWGDRGHLHHKLLDVLGWGRRRIALFYWTTSLLLGILSLYLNTIGKTITMAVIGVGVFAFLIWAKYQQTHSRTTKL